MARLPVGKWVLDELAGQSQSVAAFSDISELLKGKLTVKFMAITLKRVRMAVYFLDAGGARVGEKELTIMSSENIMNADPPLKPNYSKDFGYILEDDASKEWAGKVEVEISQVEFAE
ncbi:MAG: hypothetical protein HYZ72_10100 [Deltaproteobacteria bacterium]|nr:hypothetical protein [Deltaproteobacteria bacterium]